MPIVHSVYDIIQLVISLCAIIISVIVAVQATHKEKIAEKKAKDTEIARLKAEEIKLLLGEKETVGFAAFKLM